MRSFRQPTPELIDCPSVGYKNGGSSCATAALPGQLATTLATTTHTEITPKDIRSRRDRGRRFFTKGSPLWLGWTEEQSCHRCLDANLSGGS
jgi:hypothetical protein